jgi:putative flippase GtrA
MYVYVFYIVFLTVEVAISIQIRSFLKFAALSGTGWLADLTLLLLLVKFAATPASIANVISSSVAAVSVFLVSRHLVFSKAEGKLAGRVGLYFAYTLCVILLASVAMDFVSRYLVSWSAHMDIVVSASALAAVAKVIITPPQLFMNFLASRLLAESRLAVRVEQHD